MLARFLRPCLLLAAGPIALSAPAAADPPPWAGHGKHRGREWREDRWEREYRDRHEARRSRRGYDAAPAPAYAPPPGYSPYAPLAYAPPAYVPPPPPMPCTPLIR